MTAVGVLCIFLWVILGIFAIIIGSLNEKNSLLKTNLRDAEARIFQLSQSNSYLFNAYLAASNNGNEVRDETKEG